MAIIARFFPLVLCTALIIIAPWFLSDGQLNLASEMFIVLIICSAWNLLAGYTGLMSLGHQAYFGIGGYAVFIASNSLNLHPFLMLPAGALAAALAALILAPLMFRLRDAYFAIGSWVLAEIIFIIFQRAPALGGITGMPLFTGSMLGREVYSHVFWIAGALAVLTILGSFLFLRSGFGLGLMCVRDNETAAAAIGISVWRNRLIAYVISAGMVGLVGGLYLLPNYFIQPGTAFSAEWTVIMTFVVVIGGIGTLEGPIVGTLIYFAIRQITTSVLGLPGSWYLVALGLAAILTMLFAPQGVWPLLRNRFKLDWLSVRHKAPSQ